MKVISFLGYGVGVGSVPLEDIQKFLDANPNISIVFMTQTSGPTGYIHTTIIYREA